MPLGLEEIRAILRQRREEAGPDSDLDILVTKDALKPRVGRRILSEVKMA